MSALARAGLTLATLCLAWPGGALGAVNDIFPSDYTALPDGSLNVMYYLGHRQQSGPYARGERQFDGRLDVETAAVRLSYHMSVGDRYTFAPVAVVSWAQSHASPGLLSSRIGDEASGMGDLRLGGSFWFYRDPEKRRHAAISLIGILPTGAYDAHRVLNIGENRWRTVLGGGLIWPLGERWMVDVSPEIAWYGANDDYLGRYKLEQETSYALTGYLRYRVTPQFQLVGGAQVNRGGATMLNGIEQHNAPDNNRLSLGLLYLTPQRQQWQLRYSRDTRMENGFKTSDEFVLRYATTF